MSADIVGAFDALDLKLVSQGWHRLSDWWQETLARFIRSGRRQLVVRAGRRAGKSSSLVRFAVAWGLLVPHRISIGDIGWVTFLSVSREEASSRMRTVTAALDALGVGYSPAGDGAIIVNNTRIGFRVLAATAAASVGWTSVCIIADEVARWRNADGANPASEVLAALRPSMANQPLARIILSSSPVSTFDAHYAAFELGETDHQVVAFAESWIANPTEITEEGSRADEPDEAIWRREYAAIPSAESDEAMWTAEEQALCTRTTPLEIAPSPTMDELAAEDWGVLKGWRFSAAMDPATRRDVWTLILLGRAPGTRIARVCLARQWKPTPNAKLSPLEVLEGIAKALKPYNVTKVATDQASGDALVDLGRRIALTVDVRPTSASSQSAEFEGLRLAIQQREIELSPERDLLTDLSNVRRRFSANGVKPYLPRQNGRHCDFAPALATALALLPPPTSGNYRPRLLVEPSRWTDGFGNPLGRGF